MIINRAYDYAPGNDIKTFLGDFNGDYCQRIHKIDIAATMKATTRGPVLAHFVAAKGIAAPSIFWKWIYRRENVVFFWIKHDQPNRYVN